jgi:glycosyltransferase involved in cell wall biosynthesis
LLLISPPSLKGRGPGGLGLESASNKISIALVTRNRPDSLERTLRSLRAQSVQPWEVVISDDSDDTHRAAVERLAAEYDCRYVRGPQQGLYANRNHVALACRGTHIRTMDDDHTFLPEHFARCREAVEADPQSIWIIAEYEPAKEMPGVMPQCPAQLNARGFSAIPPDPDRCWAIADGATIYPRALFDSGVRYADDFKFGAAYLEFGSRLYWLGYRIRCLPDTYLLHHVVPGVRSYNNQEMEQASRLFAGLCHSFLYQPTLRNKLLTCYEIGKQFALRPKLARNAFNAAFAGYRRQRQWARQQDSRRLQAAVANRAN